MSVISIISIIVLVVCFVVGLVRGIVRTLLRLLSIVGTVVITLFTTPYLAKALVSAPAFANINEAVLRGVSALIVAVVCIGVFSLIIHFINKKIADSQLSGINRFLGGLFYAFVGFVALILMGYVINIFSDATFMQKVVADSQKDAFANWLVTNNLFNKFMEAVAKEGGILWQFINGFKSTPSGGAEPIPSGEAGSGNVTAKIVGAIASL